MAPPPRARDPTHVRDPAFGIGSPTPASTPITSKTQPACNNASDSESASVLVSGAKSNKQCALKQKRASSSLEPTFSSVLDNKTFDSGFDAFDEDGDDW